MRYFVAGFLVAVTLGTVVQADAPQTTPVRAAHAKSRMEFACQDQSQQHSGFPNLPAELKVLCSGATSIRPAQCALEASKRGMQGWDNIAVLCQRAPDNAAEKPAICAQTAAAQGFHGWDSLAVLCHGATDDAPVQCAKLAVTVGAIGWDNVALLCRRPMSFTPPDDHPDPTECADYLIKGSSFKSWFSVSLICARSTSAIL